MAHRMTLFGPDGTNHCVVVAGTGRPIFMLHGFPLDHRMWLRQIEILSVKYQVICPEFRGFGASSLDQGYELGTLAEDIEWIRNRLVPEQSIVLCGLSMGGYVAFEYWARFATKIDRLVLCNTKPVADNETTKTTRLGMGQTATKSGTAIATEGMLDKLLASTASAECREFVRRMMLSVQPKTIAAAQTAMAQRKDFTARLSEIEIPSLIIAGGQDALASVQDTRDWAKKIRGSQFQVIDPAGHLPPVETPESFCEVLVRFLNGADAIEPKKGNN